MQSIFNPNNIIPIFPPNSAEGFQFSAFHYVRYIFVFSFGIAGQDVPDIAGPSFKTRCPPYCIMRRGLCYHL